MKKYVKIPREILEQKNYSYMTNGAKILFGILLDLKRKSGSNNRIDDRGYRYVVLTKRQMQGELGCSRHTVDKYTKELELTGLIRFEYSRTPLYVRRIYVRSFDPCTAFVSMEYEIADNNGGSKDLTIKSIDQENNKIVQEATCEKKESDMLRKERTPEDLKANKQISFPPSSCTMSKAEAAALTLKNIRMMTCLLEEMIGEFYENEG